MIKPDYVSLTQLLQNRLFRVPDYQRAYSWKRKQRLDLFHDIEKIKQREDGDHFLATIVLMQTPQREEAGPNEFTVYDIVDGQQRLTTLVILLKTIALALARSSSEEQRYASDLNDLLVKRENSRLILLQTNHESAHDFRRFLTEGLVPDVGELRTTAQRCLVDAFKECADFVQDWDGGPTQLLKMVKNRLTGC